VVAAEPLAEGAQLSTELRCVVDLSVEDEAVKISVAPHRLVATVDVDDAQPTHPKGDALVLEDAHATIVWPSVDQRISHRVDGLA
jgi:hypothetical protein